MFSPNQRNATDDQVPVSNSVPDHATIPTVHDSNGPVFPVHLDAPITPAPVPPVVPVDGVAPAPVAPSTPPPAEAPPASRFVDDPTISAAFGQYDHNSDPRSEHHAAQLAEKLSNVRAAARERDFYLASGPAFINRVTWFEDGNSHIIVDKAQAFTTLEARAAHAAEPLLNPKPPLPDLAPLYVIGTIGSNCCFLHCDGNYKHDGPSAAFRGGFGGTTLTCALLAPPDRYPALVEDYARARQSLSVLFNHFKKPCAGATYEKPKEMASEIHVRLRHKVFQVRTCSPSRCLFPFSLSCLRPLEEKIHKRTHPYR